MSHYLLSVISNKNEIEKSFKNLKKTTFISKRNCGHFEVKISAIKRNNIATLSTCDVTLFLSYCEDSTESCTWQKLQN